MILVTGYDHYLLGWELRVKGMLERKQEIVISKENGGVEELYLV